MHVDTDEGPVAVVALGPIAVRPGQQRLGFGGAVIRDGLARLRDRTERLVLVLGHPSYYARLGFDPAFAQHVSAPWGGAAWMGLHLHGEPIRRDARYPAPWSDLDG